MENNFNNREFEQFVKQNADQYRMFPSEKVWKGIHHTLHTRRRWYGLGLLLLLLTTASVTWVMLGNAGKNQRVADLTAAALSTPGTEKKIITQTSFVPAAPLLNKAAEERKTSSSLFTEDFVNNTPDNNIPASPGEQTASVTDDAESVSMTEPVPAVTPAVPATAIAAEKPVFLQPGTPTPEKRISAEQTITSQRSETTVNPLATPENKTGSPLLADKKSATLTKDIPGTAKTGYPTSPARRKMSWQVYITPTISYRKLKENRDFITSARAGAVSPGNYIMLSDVNSVVTHKPDIGLQLGVMAGYPVSPNLRLLAGLQFNVSKYNIKAYKHSIEVATIALDNGYYSSSVSTYTNYRNFGGYSTDWLHNLYISASVPLGMEWILSNKGKTQFGISGTLQPTYILGERAYLLSTDYKNYAEVPSLTRRWNMNTSFEAFAGYKTGKLSWRVGPQVRYQLMSSFKEKYPVKEHLFDFGLKMGVQITK